VYRDSRCVICVPARRPHARLGSPFQRELHQSGSGDTATVARKDRSRIEGISDGTSKTIMLAEVAVGSGRNSVRGSVGEVHWDTQTSPAGCLARLQPDGSLGGEIFTIP